MSLMKRTRRSVVIGNEMLESRELLNAHVPHSVAAEVETIHAAAVARTITGTLTGTSAFFPNPTNPKIGNDNYQAAGPATLGTAQLVAGSDQVVSVLTSKTTYKDTYLNGSWALTLGNGSTLNVTYTGTGKSLVTNGPYSASLQGKALVTSGPATGNVLSFKATVVGNDTTDAVKIQFTLK